MSVTLKETKGYYYGRVRLSGKETTVSLGTDSPIVARGRIEEVKTVQKEISEGCPVLFSWETGGKGARGNYPTMGQALDLFIAQKRRERNKETTLAVNRWVVGMFVKFMGNETTIEKVSEKHLVKWLYLLIERGRPNTTVNSYLKILKVFLRWLNDTYGFTIPLDTKKLKTTSQIRYIPDYLFDSILAEAEKINPLLVWAYEFYRRTGARLREIYLADIFPMTLRVAADKSKGGRARIIPLQAGEADKVKELRAAYSPERLSRLFHIISERAGEAHRFHDLRHTAGVLIYIETRDIMEVKMKLGHSSVTMSERYTTFDYYQLREDFPERFAGDASRLKMAR
jgi:integrase